MGLESGESEREGGSVPANVGSGVKFSSNARSSRTNDTPVETLRRVSPREKKRTGEKTIQCRERSVVQVSKKLYR
jgi:hypothetical protein